MRRSKNYVGCSHCPSQRDLKPDRKGGPFHVVCGIGQAVICAVWPPLTGKRKGGARSAPPFHSYRCGLTLLRGWQRPSRATVRGGR
jgi:hypothetical protein